jgi:chromosome partitioning protein
MIASIVNQKGGVGKSTIAVHLAIALFEQGVKVVLVDTDPQKSAAGWAQAAAPELPLICVTDSDGIIEQLPQLATSYDMVVVDGPPGLGEPTRAILLKTDIALFPVTPSGLDVISMGAAIRVLKQVHQIRNGMPKAFAVPNRIQIQYKLSRELLEASNVIGLPFLPHIRHRQAFAEASMQFTTVHRMGSPGRDAAEELDALFEALQPHFHPTLQP